MELAKGKNDMAIVLTFNQQNFLPDVLTPFLTH